MNCTAEHKIILAEEHAPVLRTLLQTLRHPPRHLHDALQTRTLTPTQAHHLTVLLAAHLQALTDRGTPNIDKRFDDVLNHLDPDGRIAYALSGINIDLFNDALAPH